MAGKGLEPVRSVAAAGETGIDMGGCRTFAVMVIPDGSAVGDFVVSASIDGGTEYATIHTETVTASTNVVLHFVDLPFSNITIDTSGISAGNVTSQVARLWEDH